jgi:hypothetical protein
VISIVGTVVTKTEKISSFGLLLCLLEKRREDSTSYHNTTVLLYCTVLIGITYHKHDRIVTSLLSMNRFSFLHDDYTVQGYMLTSKSITHIMTVHYVYRMSYVCDPQLSVVTRYTTIHASSMNDAQSIHSTLLVRHQSQHTRIAYWIELYRMTNAMILAYLFDLKHHYPCSTYTSSRTCTVYPYSRPVCDRPSAKTFRPPNIRRLQCTEQKYTA